MIKNHLEMNQDSRKRDDRGGKKPFINNGERSIMVKDDYVDM